MTSEQREAIDRLKDDIKYAELRDTVNDDCTICFIEDLGTVLSLIKEQEQVIELMAKAFKQDDVRTVEEIKQYFERKVEDVKN